VSFTHWQIWLLLLVIGLGTFALRLSFIHWFGSREMPAWLGRPLRFVPAAVLPALVAPAVIYGGDAPGFSADNPRLLAALVAAVVAWRSRNVLWTLAAGMIALWIIQAVG
jgi:branched-subunit amino acid transport protein